MLYCLWSNIDLPTFFFSKFKGRQTILTSGKDKGLQHCVNVYQHSNSVLPHMCWVLAMRKEMGGFCSIYQLQRLTLNEVFYKVFIKSPRVLTLCVCSQQMVTLQRYSWLKNCVKIKSRASALSWTPLPLCVHLLRHFLVPSHVTIVRVHAEHHSTLVCF